MNRIDPTTSAYPSFTLLHLSTELLIEILTYVPVPDLFSVQWTCRKIRDIIVGTAYLQYIMCAHINGVDDFLPPDVPYSERLELLRRHEQSWSGLQFNLFVECATSIPYPNHFTLQDGYLIYQSFGLVGNTLRYGYTDICSATPKKELRWTHITVDNDYLPRLPLRVIFAVDWDLAVAIRFVSFFPNHTCKSDK
jgi:hypothetical protein